MRYVTYVLLDSNDVPFYVGAGLPSRPLSHFKPKGGGRPEVNKIIKQHREKDLTVNYKILGEFESKDEAFLAEKFLISTIGKIEQGGTLVNICDGGAGATGFKHSEVQNLQNSLRQKIRFGSLEERNKTSETTKIGMSDPNVRRKVSEGLLKKWQDDDFRNQQVLSHTGKKDSCETKQKKSKSLVESWENGIRKGKYSDAVIMDVYSKKGLVKVEDVAEIYGMNPTYVHKIWRHERCRMALKRLGVI